MNIRLNQRSSPFISESQRSAIAVGLMGIGLIHTLDLPSKWHETPYLGVAYVVLIGASLIAAAGVVASTHRRWLQLAIAAAASPLLGYALSRTTGLPLANGDVGNWFEPLGLASLFVEAMVLLLIAQCSLAINTRSLRSA